jgi:hypothetical protein
MLNFFVSRTHTAEPTNWKLEKRRNGETGILLGQDWGNKNHSQNEKKPPLSGPVAAFTNREVDLRNSWVPKCQNSSPA